MQRIGTFETESLKDLGINYLKGILDTYGSLNQPETTLSYDYNIIRVEKDDQDLSQILKNKFDIFTNQPFKLDLITNDSFKKVLKSWLFEEELFSVDSFNNTLKGWLSSKKLISVSKKDLLTVCLYNLIKEVTDFQSIYAINGLDSIEVSYDFGVGYDYFILDSIEYLYIIYFSYSD